MNLLEMLVVLTGTLSVSGFQVAGQEITGHHTRDSSQKPTSEHDRSSRCTSSRPLPPEFVLSEAAGPRRLVGSPKHPTLTHTEISAESGLRSGCVHKRAPGVQEEGAAQPLPLRFLRAVPELVSLGIHCNRTRCREQFQKATKAAHVLSYS